MSNKYIEDIDFGSSTYYVLKRSGINKEEELLNLLFFELKKVRNIGVKRVVEILTVLSNKPYLEEGYSIARNKDNDFLMVKELVEKINHGDFD